MIVHYTTTASLGVAHIESQKTLEAKLRCLLPSCHFHFSNKLFFDFNFDLRSQKCGEQVAQYIHLRPIKLNEQCRNAIQGAATFVYFSEGIQVPFDDAHTMKSLLKIYSKQKSLSFVLKANNRNNTCRIHFDVSSDQSRWWLRIRCTYSLL
jgi:hypothetical protein